LISISQPPILEKIPRAVDTSISYRKFSDELPNGEPVWHYHPEIELVFIKSGNGKRHIGNHISYYTSGDLLLIGKNLPHYGFANRLTRRNTEIILQFSADFIGDTSRIPELRAIQGLLDRSKFGISFQGGVKRKVGALLDQMSIQGAFKRMLTTIEVLQLMATAQEYSLLNVNEIAIKANKQNKDRIKAVYDYVRENFQSHIAVSDVAHLISMTEPSFCRYFKKQTDSTFTQFVNEFRVIHACKLLSETSRSIADICFECGFNNFSHFNNKFKSITSKSPREYRDEFKEVIVGV